MDYAARAEAGRCGHGAGHGPGRGRGQDRGHGCGRAMDRAAMGHGPGHGGPMGGGFGWGGPDGDGFGRGFGGGRGGRGGGRRRLFDNGELRLLLLHLIAQEPRHGYDLIRALEGLSGGMYVPSPGMVYPALTMMTEMDQIVEQPSEGTRKIYAAAPEGTAFLAAHATERDALLARLDKLAQEAAPTPDMAPVRRAMDNLKVALRNRLNREGADADTLLDVAGLIDEAAAKIERLK